MPRYWLVKTEIDSYSIDDLARDKATDWDGVRNYQARNFLKDMKVGDAVFIYHSNAEPSGIVGLARVKKVAYPDPSQFDRKSKYYDEGAREEEPRWFCPELEHVRTYKRPCALEELRSVKGLEKMELLRKGSRLSVTPVSEHEYKIIENLVR